MQSSDCNRNRYRIFDCIKLVSVFESNSLRDSLEMKRIKFKPKYFKLQFRIDNIKKFRKRCLRCNENLDKRNKMQCYCCCGCGDYRCKPNVPRDFFDNQERYLEKMWRRVKSGGENVRFAFESGLINYY